MRISDWSSDVCSSDLLPRSRLRPARDAALWRPWPQRARAHRARSLQRRTPARLCRKRLESHLLRAALLGWRLAKWRARGQEQLLLPAASGLARTRGSPLRLVTGRAACRERECPDVLYTW